jgi:DNA-directed RNA polymerase subunit omega
LILRSEPRGKRSSFLSGQFADRLLNLGNRAHFKIIAGLFGQGNQPCCGIGFLDDSGRSRSTKEENQPPVRAKVGATLVLGRKSESIMKADLIAAASEVITNQQILVNMVSRRVRQLSLGHRPLVEYAPGLREADIALTEIANGKLTFESTFGQDGIAEAPSRVMLFPSVKLSKKVKKAA